MLATLAQFKTRYAIAGTAEDTLITQVLTGVTAQLVVAAGRVYDGRPCLERGSLTVLLDVPEPYTRALWLPAWPVVSITSVKEALYGDFASASALVENTDYQLRRGTGRLSRIGFWLVGEQTVQMICVAGYTPPSEYLAEGYTQGAGEVLLPDDILEAALQQAGFVHSRRDQLGLTATSVQGGSVSAYAQDKLLPGVAETMGRYARMAG